MRKNLEILGVEDTKDGRPRQTAAGVKYARVNTSDGWMSCFDMKAVEQIKGLLDKTASLEVVTKGEYNNILKCYGEAIELSAIDKPVEIVKPGEAPVINLPNLYPVPQEIKLSRNTTMYTSYAKDIFIALIGERESSKGPVGNMDKAIELVNQAKTAFE